MHTQPPQLPKDERAAMATIYQLYDVKEECRKQHDIVGFAMADIAIFEAEKQLKENRRKAKI